MKSTEIGSRSVLVVGGGAIGCSVALESATAGHDVTVLDANEVGSRDACSFGSAGIICPSMTSPLTSRKAVREGLLSLATRGDSFSLRPHPGLGRWLGEFTVSAFARRTLSLRSAALRNMALESLALHHSYVANGIETSLFPRGILYLYDTPKGLRSALTPGIDGAMRDQVWSAKDLRATYPFATDKIAGGIHREWEAFCESGRYVRAVAGAAERAGAKFMPNTAVDRAIVEGGRVGGVRTTDGRTLRADVVVVTAGTGSRALMRSIGADLPLEGGYGYHIEVESRPDDPAVPLYLAGSHLIATPVSGGLRIAGGLHLDGPGTKSAPVPVDRILHEGAKWIRDLRARKVLSTWTGARPCISDGIPAIGWVPGSDSVIVATGHAMLGITLAPATGRLVADLLSARPLPWYSVHVSPDRFRRTRRR